MPAISRYQTLIFLFILCFSATAQEKDSIIVRNNLEISNDTTFVNLKNYSNAFIYDLKYATEDNFLKETVYDCAECYLRYKTVKALIIASERFAKDGFQIKLFDCYRSLDVQKKMWKIVNNPSYVANPKTGSVHNRGKAVDLTLVDAEGNELDMGTAFDFFGPESSHNYADLSKKIKKNRAFLKEIMIKNNFKPLNSEWWHYNLNESAGDNLANFKWICE